MTEDQIDVLVRLVRAVAKSTSFEALEDPQVRMLEGYISRTIERRAGVRAGKKEHVEAQEKDDVDLKAALQPSWMDLV